jgi:hypothetical protein
VVFEQQLKKGQVVGQVGGFELAYEVFQKRRIGPALYPLQQ